MQPGATDGTPSVSVGERVG